MAITAYPVFQILSATGVQQEPSHDIDQSTERMPATQMLDRHRVEGRQGRAAQGTRLGRLYQAHAPAYFNSCKEGLYSSM